jgi:hypothetical protein
VFTHVDHGRDSGPVQVEPRLLQRGGDLVLRQLAAVVAVKLLEGLAGGGVEQGGELGAVGALQTVIAVDCLSDKTAARS